MCATSNSNMKWLGTRHDTRWSSWSGHDEIHSCLWNISRSSLYCPPRFSWYIWRCMSLQRTLFCIYVCVLLDSACCRHIRYLSLTSILAILGMHCGGRVAAWYPNNTNCTWVDIWNPQSCMKYESLEYSGHTGMHAWNLDLRTCTSL